MTTFKTTLSSAFRNIPHVNAPRKEHEEGDQQTIDRHENNYSAIGGTIAVILFYFLRASHTKETGTTFQPMNHCKSYSPVNEYRCLHLMDSSLLASIRLESSVRTSASAQNRALTGRLVLCTPRKSKQRHRGVGVMVVSIVRDPGIWKA